MVLVGSDADVGSTGILIQLVRQGCCWKGDNRIPCHGMRAKQVIGVRIRQKQQLILQYQFIKHES
jgi:hypothetical protein